MKNEKDKENGLEKYVLFLSKTAVKYMKYASDLKNKGLVVKPCLTILSNSSQPLKSPLQFRRSNLSW